MRRRAVVLLVATAVGLIGLAGSGLAGPAPAPEELWSEFPLEAPPEQTPAPQRTTTPRSDRSTRPADAVDGSATPWVLLGLGAAAAAATTAALAYGRRRPSAPHLPATLREERRSAATRRPRRLTTEPAPPRSRPSRTAAETPVHIGAVRASSSFVGVLSPRIRLDEQAEERDAQAPATGLQLCEIRWWRGYLKSQFYIEADPPLESRSFRARGGDVHEPSEEALAVHAAFVEELTAAGWQPHGRGVHWYSDRFRKIS